MWEWIENEIIDPIHEIDIFYRNRFISSGTVRFMKRDLQSDLEKVWGHKKDHITIIRYPRKLPSASWEIESRDLMSRTYINNLTGEKKVIKGTEHGKNYFYKWRVSLSILYLRCTGFFRFFLSKQWL